MTIGEIIYNRRIELGLTLEEVGNAVGVGKSTVKKWESGFISNMRRDKIAKLSEILNLSPSVFISQDLNEKSAPLISETDAKDIEMFNSLNEEQRQAVRTLIETLLNK